MAGHQPPPPQPPRRRCSAAARAGAVWEASKGDGGALGGVEFALIGASADRDAAVRAASASEAQVLIQLEQGAVDRGADLSWLSQYESDKRLYLPPMTALETKRTYIGGTARLDARGRLVDGGELLVVCLDVKVAWPRTAAKPGRLQIAQLERARATLEGRLAEEATRHANLHVAFEELKCGAE